MKNLIVKLAYLIESSKSYHRFRTFLVNILLNNNTRHKRIFDLFIIFLVISTVGILIYEVKNDLPDEVIYYEYFAVGIFILEWIGRFIVSFESHKQIIRDYEESQLLNIDFSVFHSFKIIIQEKLRFVFSLASIIDLLAILPSYRPLRILRIFLIFRLFKVLKYTNSINQFIRVFVEKKYELSLLLVLYLLAIFFSATILYVYEGHSGINLKIESFFDAMYWSFITVSTIGYGDITPQTEIGKSVTLILILTGYAVIAFFTSIVTSSISEKLYIIKENNQLNNISKLKNVVLICGYGKVADVLVDNLLKRHYNILIIEEDVEKIEQAEKLNLPVIKDDATNIDFLKKAGIGKNVRYVFALSNDDEVNLSIILGVRSISDDVTIVSRCNYEKTKKKLKIAGANEVFDITDEASTVGIGFMHHPVTFDAIDDILVDHRGAILNNIEIYETSHFIGKKLHDVDFNQYNITFVGVVPEGKVENFMFNPKKDYVLQAKDFLIVIGYELTINKFKTYLQV